MEAAGGFVCWTLSGRDVALKTELVFVLVLRILIASEIIAKTDLVNLIHHEIKYYCGDTTCKLPDFKDGAEMEDMLAGKLHAVVEIKLEIWKQAKGP